MVIDIPRTGFLVSRWVSLANEAQGRICGMRATCGAMQMPMPMNLKTHIHTEATHTQRERERESAPMLKSKFVSSSSSSAHHKGT
jgi:hypothetical protein